MVIILNVDASANNVGQIDLPFVPTADTELYLNSIPVTAANLTNQKKRALDDFFIFLNENNLKSKIEHAYIPLFGRLEGGVNLVNPSFNIAWPSDTAVAEFSSDGIKFKQGWLAGFQVNRQNLHVGFYNTTSSNYVGGNTQASINPNGQIFGRVANGGQAAWTIAASKRATVQNRNLSIGCMLGVCDVVGSGSAYINVDGEASPAVEITSVDLSTNPIALVYGNASVGGLSQAMYSHGYFTDGIAMTPSELALYNAAITTLITALLAA